MLWSLKVADSFKGRTRLSGLIMLLCCLLHSEGDPAGFPDTSSDLSLFGAE